MYNLKITHLCMGLGLSVLIELNYSYDIYYTSRFVGLLDCGSIGGGEAFYGPALNKIKNAVSLNGGVLDYVHISHFDADHYNKLKILGKKYQEENEGSKIWIHKIYFGCTGNKDVECIKKMLQECFNIWEGNFMILNDYWYCPGSLYKAHSESPCFHDYSIDLGNQYYFNISMLLYHAHLCPTYYPELENIHLDNEGVLINTGSSILMVSITKEEMNTIIPKVSYIFTGDATLKTMQIMRYIQEKQMTLRFCKEYKLLQIAHHGAKRYVADNEEANDFPTLKWFLDMIRPSAAVVSAKCKNLSGWTHPNYDTMQVYGDFLHPVPGPGWNLTSFVWDRQIEKMKVRQCHTNKLLYETFRLKSDEECAGDKKYVGDGDLYERYNKDSTYYEKIDVAAYTGSYYEDTMHMCEELR